MTDRRDESFADFVVREQPALLRLAFQLAGSRRGAEDLVHTALAKTYARWNRLTRLGDPSAYVRRILVATHTSRRRRMLHGEQLIESEIDAGALADRVGAPSDGLALAERIAGQESRRRRTTAVTIAGLVLAASAAALVLVGTDPEEPRRTVLAVPSAPVADVFAGPPRGSLAGDAEFVDGVRRLTWIDEEHAGLGLPDAPLDTRRVVFAGVVPSGRWALVVGSTAAVEQPPYDDPDPRTGGAPATQLAAVWFAGPSGATPAEMRPATVPRVVDPEEPATLIEPRRGALVVIGAPGDVVWISERPDIAADGATSRSYRPVPTRDGVAVVALPPSEFSYTAATTYRVVRNGAAVVDRGQPEAFEPPEAPPPIPLAPDVVRTPVGPETAQVTESAILAPLAELGLPRDAVEVTVLWSGRAPGEAGRAARAALVAITLPSGAVVVNGEWRSSLPDGHLVGGRCGTAILPSGAPVEERVLATRCEVVSGTVGAASRRMLVVAVPRNVALVRVYNFDGRFVGEYQPSDGVVVVPLPHGTATVEAVTPGGVGLGRTPLLHQVADFGD